MLARYCGPGLLGLGVTALIAGFMSGMAGNVSAFATVWTYDIYRPYIHKRGSDRHYLRVGRWCTILGVIVSIGTAYLVTHFKSIMDYMQALVSFFIAPLFGTVILGMLWKRATPKAGFWGLLAGTVSSIAMYTVVVLRPGFLRYIALSPDAKPMAENLYRALWSWLICVSVTVVVSLLHCAEACGTTHRSGLWIYRYSGRRRPSLLQASSLLGNRRRHLVCHIAVCLLVTESAGRRIGGNR